MLYLCLFVLLLIAGFIFQVWPRFYNRRFGIDTWRYLDIADYIRKCGFPKENPPKYLIRGPFDYPPVFLWLLSRLSKTFLHNYQWLASPFINAINAAFVFAASYYLTGSGTASLWIAALFLLIPIIALEASQLSTRPISILVFNMLFFSVLLFINSLGSPGNDYILFFFISVALLTLLLLTHKMAIQATFFIFLFFSIWQASFWYLTIFISAVILAIAVSKGYYIKIFKGHLAILTFWLKNYRLRYAHQIRGLDKKDASPDPIIKIQQLLSKMPLASTIGANPWIVFIGAGAFMLGPDTINILNFKGEVFDLLFYTPIVLFTVGTLIKWVPQLAFIGEGERYLEYSAFAAAVMSVLIMKAALATEYRMLFIILFLGCLLLGCIFAIITLQKKVILEDKERTVTDDLLKMFDYMRSIKEPVRLATMPLYLVAFTMYFVDNIRVLSTESAVAHVTDLIDYFPVLKKPLSEIFGKYGINYLLVNEHYVKVSELDLPDINIDKKIGHYTLLRV